MLDFAQVDRYHMRLWLRVIYRLHDWTSSKLWIKGAKLNLTLNKYTEQEYSFLLMKEIIILVDDRKFFYSSTKEMGGSLGVIELKKQLEKLAYKVDIKRFYEINFTNSYKGRFILYQSTEDPDLRYKDYIEDVLLGLKDSGAILIPDFSKFRAHHNKVYMEILREQMCLNKGTSIYSKRYGTFEEFKEDIDNYEFPVVIKKALGLEVTELS